jgi:NADPH2:quinone reductase
MELIDDVEIRRGRFRFLHSSPTRNRPRALASIRGLDLRMRSFGSLMRRVICPKLGSLDDLVVEDTAPLVPGPGQVVLDVKAAGVNFVDALIVKGGYQIKPPTPFTPGGEVAGVVAAVGAGVDTLAPGDRAVASCWLGGFAEQVATAAESAFPLPAPVSFEAGAALVQSYATAVFALTRRIRVEPGEWVLVLGAGGGVGRAAVDVARSLGARVIGAASTEEKRAAAEEAGAEATIDTSAEDVKVRARELAGGGVDVVVDPVGGALAEPALRALRVMGRYLVIGFAAGEIPRLPLNQVLLNNRAMVGVDWGAWMSRWPAENRSLIQELLEGVAGGRLHPPTPATAPLDRVAEVLDDVSSRRVTGKVVLVP